MAQRGRPPGSRKLLPVHKFVSRLLAVWQYNEKRKAGLKHESAILEVVDEQHRQFSEFGVSEGELKRLLAKRQPKGVPYAIVIDKSTDRAAEESLERLRTVIASIKADPGLKRLAGRVPRIPKTVSVFTFGIGPRPKHPRTNAKSRS